MVIGDESSKNQIRVTATQLQLQSSISIFLA